MNETNSKAGLIREKHLAFVVSPRQQNATEILSETPRGSNQ